MEGGCPDRTLSRLERANECAAQCARRAHRCERCALTTSADVLYPIEVLFLLLIGDPQVLAVVRQIGAQQVADRVGVQLVAQVVADLVGVLIVGHLVEALVEVHFVAQQVAALLDGLIGAQMIWVAVV